MSAGRFFVRPEVLTTVGEVVLPEGIAHQVRQVLRLRPDDTMTLLDGSGMAYTMRLTRVDRERVVGVVVARAPVETEPRARVLLSVGLLKADKFDWVIQKGTEIGVQTIVPLITERTLAGLADRSPARQARWTTIAREAAEQSDRGRYPDVLPPLSLATALERVGEDAALIAWEDVGDPRSLSIADALAQVTGRGGGARAIHLFIGPEGGFAPSEIARAVAAGARPVALGPRILRAETAAIVAATLTLAALDELGPRHNHDEGGARQDAL